MLIKDPLIRVSSGRIEEALLGTGQRQQRARQSRTDWGPFLPHISASLFHRHPLPPPRFVARFVHKTLAFEAIPLRPEQ